MERFGLDALPVEHTMMRIGELRPLGQLHNSFIIAAGTDGLWIIDQHVAHERILFEQVLAQQASGRAEVQQLLMPMILQLTADQQIEYARIADELHASGFDTEPFGNRTIAVKGAPASISPGDLERVILEILEIAENELRSVSVPDLRRGIAASIACRAAIKINTPLDQRKMEWMLRTLGGHRIPDGLPARTTGRTAVWNPRNPAGVPSDLIRSRGRWPAFSPLRTATPCGPRDRSTRGRYAIAGRPIRRRAPQDPAPRGGRF